MIQPFSPAVGLGNCHLQTIFPRFHRPKPWIRTQCQWLATPDGDRLALHTPAPLVDTQERPIILVLHGLEGSVESPYVQGLMQALLAQDFQVAVLHFRGCGGIPNLLPRAYHSGVSEDPRWLASHLRDRYPNTPLMAVGYSLGGNVLLKWLGEDGADTPISAAVSVSAPLDLHASSRRMGQGFSKVYQRHLLNSLQQSLRKKALDPELARQMPALDDKRYFTDFRHFDDHFTAPLHGFRGVDDYYTRASSKPLLRLIQTPTLIIHATDDPFVCPSAVPSHIEISPNVELDITSKGGHVGFVSGSIWRPEYWLEQRIPQFLTGWRSAGRYS
ncbi:hydrolase [Microbulbifer bruguierae]|uniref:Hydrolase n=1 Tax=Microbulbifer bruguierae TaxID=3029061 RepID=A0ABY8NHB0_9GAMM|nr:hydrolase [Microbulbifer bruguierae]WGL17087.1 hydrolase [Microbulbifer bruguierae]